MIESVFGELLSELADQTLRILVEKAMEQVAERLAVKQEDGEVQVNLVCFTLISLMNIFF